MQEIAAKPMQLPKLTPNVNRILAAIAFVIGEAAKRGHNLSQYDLVKTLFLADRAHLNEWGRPITFDNYAAMKHGPVPSLAYDLLKANSKALKDYQIAALPWVSKDQGMGKKHFFPVEPSFPCGEYLSESDIEALSDSLGTVLRLGFGQIRMLTHLDPAYVAAWRDDDDKAAYAMNLALLFDTPNAEQAEHLAEYSAYV